jgi:alanyl-tRNA synthetase
MTADFDGELSDADIRNIEELANKAVFECHPIRAYYPDAEELASLEYRSKLELSDGVRIVEIEGVDRCACCAPHVENTGEIGLIKIIEAIRYKGGMRLTILAGYDALEDYVKRCEQIRRVSMSISAKQEENAEGVDRVLDEMSALHSKIAALKREKIDRLLVSIEATEGSISIFEKFDDMNEMRNFANGLIDRAGRVCAVFSGDDKCGYKFVILSKTVDLKSLSKEISEKLGGKGGGSSIMMQGSCTANREEIEKVIEGI